MADMSSGALAASLGENPKEGFHCIPCHLHGVNHHPASAPELIEGEFTPTNKDGEICSLSFKPESLSRQDSGNGPQSNTPLPGKGAK